MRVRARARHAPVLASRAHIRAAARARAATGDVIVSSEPHIGYYSLFRRAAPVRGGEACSLPSRDARGWTGAHSHYLVLLRPATLAELEGAQPRAAAAAGAAGAEAGPSLR